MQHCRQCSGRFFAAALALSTVHFSLQGPQLCCKRQWERQWREEKEPAELHLLPVAGVQLCYMERGTKVGFLGVTPLGETVNTASLL